jgi:GTP-binding protein
MSKKVPIVAIVGRANVGKSSLFNAVLERREAIVAREAGTTRDSIMAKASYKDRDFWLVDTAGMKDAEDEFEFTIQEQIQQATDSADIIWVVVEADASVTEEDRRVAKVALKSKKPVFLVLNKIDKLRGESAPFERLGIKQIFPTSTTQHRGIEALLDATTEVIPKASIKEDDDRLHIALLGRPNVGKSYLFNTLSKKQQAIVADRAGTTRDINRTAVRYKGQEIELMDTAGIRRSGKIERGIEHFSVLRSLAAIEQADICLLVIDVNELGVQLDQKIAGMIKEAGKGLIIVVSKWDVAEGKDAYTRDALAPQIVHTFNFVPWAPLIFTSAVTGKNVAQIFELALEIKKRREQKFATKDLNRWLQTMIHSHPPAGLKNRQPKLNYMVHEDDNPIPAFKIFGSQTKFLHWSYKRYLERNLREQYDFAGTPVQLWFIEKHIPHKHHDSPTKAPRR